MFRNPSLYRTTVRLEYSSTDSPEGPMAYNTDKLCQKARELALQHIPSAVRSLPRYLSNQFNEDIESLKGFVISLQDSPAGCAQPAEEWLLDNAEFIEEQAVEVKTHLFNRSLDYLPYLRKNGIL